MSNLLELAERCGAATGPDREIDCLIEIACGPDGPAIQAIMDGSPHNTVHEVAKAADRDGAALFFRVPAYTASLDAAMTLIPWEWLAEWGYYFGLEQDDFERGKWVGRFDQRGDECGHGDTILATAAAPALALTAAALRAKASSEIE